MYCHTQGIWYVYGFTHLAPLLAKPTIRLKIQTKFYRVCSTDKLA